MRIKIGLVTLFFISYLAGGQLTTASRQMDSQSKDKTFFRCKECGKFFSSKSNLTRHNKNLHRRMRPSNSTPARGVKFSSKCQRCGEISSSKSWKGRHERRCKVKIRSVERDRDEGAHPVQTNMSYAIHFTEKSKDTEEQEGIAALKAFFLWVVFCLEREETLKRGIWF